MKRQFFKPPKYKIGDVILKRNGDILKQFVIVEAYISSDDIGSDYFQEDVWKYQLNDGRLIEEQDIFFEVH